LPLPQMDLVNLVTFTNSSNQLDSLMLQSNEDILIPFDSVKFLTLNFQLSSGLEMKQIDIKFSGIPTKLELEHFFPANYNGSKNYDITKNWQDTTKENNALLFYKNNLNYKDLSWKSLAKNNNVYLAFSALNSKNENYTQLKNDVETWWPNATFNAGFDSPTASKLKIMIPIAKGEFIINAIVHDKEGKQGYFTRKIKCKS